MVRHALLALLALGLLTVPRAVEAQPVDRSVRIGLLSPGAPGGDTQAFLRGMHDLGYVEGRNLVVVSRSAHGSTERFTKLVGELVRLNVDIIVTGGTAGARAAKQATTTIPVVIGAMGDPVESGIVASLARPGGNITGLSMAMSAEFATKYLDLIRQVLPKASGVAVLSHPSMRIQVQGMERAAPSLGIRLQSLEAQKPEDIDRAFESMAAHHAAAVVVTGDPFTFTHRARIIGLAAKHRLPAIYGLGGFVDAGGLLAYAPSLTELWRRAATYVDKILKGAKPADLPVEQPTTFDLEVNLKTARTLGLTIPPSLLLQADRVIE